MRLKYWLGVAAAIASSWLLLYSDTAAQGSTLKQSIKPIECIYTTVIPSGEPALSGNCATQPIPTVTSIEGSKNRPVIKGKFSAYRASSLRVWLNGQWYTYGADGRLSVDGDEWTLDLSDLHQSLPPGEYIITVEIQTHDGYLIRHNNAGYFLVKTSLTPSIIDRPR